MYLIYRTAARTRTHRALKPCGWKSNFTSPPMRPQHLVQEPRAESRRLVDLTSGPPASCQRKAARASPAGSVMIATPPARLESAPYFTALVAIS